MNALHLPLTLLTYALWTPAALAHVWWVDDDGGPGIDHTDIQPAIDGASHGDVIVVNPGVYSGFHVDRGLTIQCADADHSSLVTGHVSIAGIAMPRRAVLTGFELPTLAVTGSTGPVILDNLLFAPSAILGASSIVGVDGCLDVRMVACSIPSSYGGSSEHAVRVRDSHFEVVTSSLHGRRGFHSGCSDAGDGGDGLRCEGSAEVLVYQTDCIGGRGGDTEYFCEWNDPWAGNGGDGVTATDASRVVLAGASARQVQGGLGGYGDEFPWPPTDGWPGVGLRLAGMSEGRYSGVSIDSFGFGPGTTPHEAMPADPYLLMSGTQQAGRELTFRVRGPAGAAATLYLGRSAIVQPAPGPVDQLITRERTFPLGVIPSGGEKSFTLVAPNWLPIGFTFYAQAEVVLGGGEERLTNSMPIVLRHLP